MKPWRNVDSGDVSSARPRRRITRLLRAVRTASAVLALMAASVYLLPKNFRHDTVRRITELASVAATPKAGATSLARVVQAAPRRERTHAPVELDRAKRKLIGVRTVRVENRTLTNTIRTSGEVAYDETRITDINLRIEGWIEKLFVDYTGRSVEKGEPLFTLYSPQLVTTQQEYLLALRTRDKVAESRLPDARRGANALVEASRRRLRLWGIEEAEIRELEHTGTPRTAMTIRSPASGFVVEKSAVEKMYVKPGMSLYRVVDLSTVWVFADIYESEMRFVHVGQPVTISLPYDGGKTFRGKVAFLDPVLDPATRTVRAQFEIPNPDMVLRPGMYVEAELETEYGPALSVPQGAVLYSGTRNLVFVDHGNGRFEPREVELGPRRGDRQVVLKGLSEGDEVVASANFFVDSESRLAAAAGGMTGKMSLIGMGDAPMAGAAMGGMEGMDGMEGMQPAPGTRDMEGMAGPNGSGAMDGMEPAPGTQATEGMSGSNGSGTMEDMEPTLGTQSAERKSPVPGMEGMEPADATKSDD